MNLIRICSNSFNLDVDLPSFWFRVEKGKGSRWSPYLPPDDVPEDGDARLENHCDSYQSKLPQVKISKNVQSVKGASQQNTMG